MAQYIGIDLHKKTSQIAVLDGETKAFVLEKSIKSLPARFAEVLAMHVGVRILIEASTMSRWVAQFLRSLGHEVVVGDPNYAVMYATRSTICKNDKNDGRSLAWANLYEHFRVVYEPTEEQRAIGELLGTRQAQVERRTAAINRVRSLFLAKGVHLPASDAACFWAKTKNQPAPMPAGVASLLDELAMLEDLIGANEKQINEIAAQHSVAQRLMTVPGVGPITALSFYVKIGDISRFKSAHHLESYLGLTPTVSTSGGPGQPFRLSKRGSTVVRSLLVQAAWSLVSSNDPKVHPLKAWFQELLQRRNTQQAIVAVARRLAGILYALWRDDATFELRERKPVTTSAPPKKLRRYQMKKTAGEDAV